MTAGMTIRLHGVRHVFGSRGERWVFTAQSTEIPSGGHAVIRGSNGSGKSTLGRIVGGHLLPAEGHVEWTYNGTRVSAEDVLTRTMISGPDVALHPLLTIAETIAYHERFRTWWPGEDPVRELKEAGLGQFMNKSLKSLSSGMSQRVQLVLALMSDSDLVVLDEPCANLDKDGVKWYRELLARTAQRTTTVVCSNHHEEDYLSHAQFVEL
jgi:ABC-type transport system involved in cytochrome c biogenesis ATPase subunit